MTSSQFGMSEHNAALVRKFQGNGWALTCSQASQDELSAMLGRATNAPRENTTPISAVPVVRYEADWADKVLERSMDWRPDDQAIPRWIIKAAEASDFAVFQVPRPDGRWFVKFAGRILEPFSPRFLGWTDLHEIMVHGCLLDLAPLVSPGSSQAEPRRTARDPLSLSTVSSSKLYVQSKDGSAGLDRWRTCADDFNRALEKRLNRVFEAIGRKDRSAASEIKRAVRCTNGAWSFNSPIKWMTVLSDLPYDAKMVLKGKVWEVEFPESNELLVVPDSAGVRAIARLLMCNNIPCPSALIAEGSLLTEFLGRPRHRRYFEAIYRRPRVDFGDPRNSEVEDAICAAMHFRPGWYYKADHVISPRSGLHTVCGLPMGRVMLRKADALVGIRDLIRKQRARLFFCVEPSQNFERILADIEAGIEFARKQENLLEQVQPKSIECRGKLQKAIARALKDIEEMGDWTTRYDLLASHLSSCISGGIIFHYTGCYRWKIEGLQQTPDALDLAEDHKAFKRNRVAKAMRGAKAKMRAMRSLDQLAKGAAS